MGGEGLACPLLSPELLVLPYYKGDRYPLLASHNPSYGWPHSEAEKKRQVQRGLIISSRLHSGYRLHPGFMLS